MTDAASVPSVDPPLVRDPTTAPISSLFAALPKWFNERRKIIKITRENGVVTSEVVKDYDQLYSDEQSALEKAFADAADSDDTPQEQEYLMQAWTAMAMYLANSDDEDKADAIAVLQAIGAMISDDDSSNGPDPNKPGAFNFSPRNEKSAMDCPHCDRAAFATPGGLANHVKTVHSPGKK
jgi:hypothetical protein